MVRAVPSKNIRIHTSNAFSTSSPEWLMTLISIQLFLPPLFAPLAFCLKLYARPLQPGFVGLVLLQRVEIF